MTEEKPEKRIDALEIDDDQWMMSLDNSEESEVGAVWSTAYYTERRQFAAKSDGAGQSVPAALAASGLAATTVSPGPSKENRPKLGLQRFCP